MNTKALQWGLLGAALAALPIELALAQQRGSVPYANIVRDGYRLDMSAAQALEAALAKNPDDLTARTKLLGYYFRGATRLEKPDVRIAARRRHILWLIEHHPGSEVTGLRQLTIDPAGHAIADKDGYEQAAKLWIEQAQRHSGDAAVLGNAGDFFLLPDKVTAEALYKRAQQAAPHDPQWSGRLGRLYAMGILGLDMMNENGLPTSHNPAEAKAAFARHARAELEKSRDVTMVFGAAMILTTYGAILDGMFRGSKRPLEVDYAPLAESLLAKGPDRDPANAAAWSQALTEFRKLREQLDRPR